MIATRLEILASPGPAPYRARSPAGLKAAAGGALAIVSGKSSRLGPLLTRTTAAQSARGLKKAWLVKPDVAPLCQYVPLSAP